jgi:SAM-dependent methyltransferase
MLSMDTAPRDVGLWPQALTEPACRLCGARLHRTLIDLGEVPLANLTLAPNAPNAQPYSLHIRMCDDCTLVQIADVAAPDAAAAPKPYRPTQSAARLSRTEQYAETIRKRLRLGTDSLVIEIGTNDGALLRPFQAAGIPVLGIGPAPTAATDVPTEIAVFNTGTAMQVAVRHGCADLVIAHGVLSHVPDLFDFAAGLASILRPNGMLSLQVPHLLSIIQTVQFDAFRHDAYTYLSLRVLEHVLRSVGLRVFDAERLTDHGGSLRVHACHVDGPHATRPGPKTVRQSETFIEFDRRDFYSGFSDRVAMARTEIRDFLRNRRAGGRRVAAYGAAAREATLLNCCGITTEEIACVADPDPARHGHQLPGSRIPIVPLEALMAAPPDDILILAWPEAAEIAVELTPLRQLGTQLWIPIPRIARA